MFSFFRKKKPEPAEEPEEEEEVEEEVEKPAKGKKKSAKLAKAVPSKSTKKKAAAPEPVDDLDNPDEKEEIVEKPTKESKKNTAKPAKAVSSKTQKKAEAAALPAKEKASAKAAKKGKDAESKARVPSPDEAAEAGGPAEEAPKKKGLKTAQYKTEGGKAKKQPQPDNVMETLEDESEEEDHPRAKRSSVIKDIMEEDWKAVAEKLPVHKTPEAREQRKTMFEQWDPNGNGMLSLAEIDKGLKETKGLESLYKCKPAIIRAYNAAKSLKPGNPDKKGLQDDDYVSSVEFRMLMVFLKLYFGLFKIFEVIDTGDDRRVDLDELTAAAPQLREWGCPIDDPEETFEEIDSDGHGQILFDEFAEWAISNNLLVTKTDAEGGAKRKALKQHVEEKAAAPKTEEKTTAAPRKRRGSAIDDLMKDDWKTIADRLPVEKTDEDKEKRKRLFMQWDPNGNGFLSLAEVDKGVNETPGLEKLYKCKPALIRAFNAAKGIKPGDPKKKKGLKDDDYVSSVEFRMLLVYLKLYFGLFQIFDAIDTGDDRRVDIKEFKAAANSLREWGCPIDDTEETFKRVDADGHGQILFDEFSEWAIGNNLLITQEEAENKAAPAQISPEELKRHGSAMLHHQRPKEEEEEEDEEEDEEDEEEEDEEEEEGEAEEEEDGEKPPMTAAEEKMSDEWKQIAETLPWRKTKEEKRRRNKLFKAFDPNGNGMLSLAEVDKALQETPGLEPLFKCKPAILRAFNAAKNVKPADLNKKGLQDDDFVSKVEFRMLLVFLKLYFGLFQIFEGIDTGGDRRVDKDEFRAAAADLREWGLPVAEDSDETFGEIDSDGAGQILFDEFSEWAIKHNLLNNEEARPSHPDPNKIRNGGNRGLPARAAGQKGEAPRVVLEGLLNDYSRVEGKVNALNKELLDMRKQILNAMQGGSEKSLAKPRPSQLARASSDTFARRR